MTTRKKHETKKSKKTRKRVPDPATVTDLREVVAVGDRLLVQHYKEKGWNQFEARRVHKTVVHGAYVGHDDVVVDKTHWSANVEHWQCGELVSVDDPRAPDILAGIRARNAREALEIRVHDLARGMYRDATASLPRRSPSLDDVARDALATNRSFPVNPHLPPDYYLGGQAPAPRPTTTVTLARLGELCEAGDQLKPLAHALREHILILARIRAEIGDDAYERLAADARAIVLNNWS